MINFWTFNGNILGIQWVENVFHSQGYKFCKFLELSLLPCCPPPLLLSKFPYFNISYLSLVKSQQFFPVAQSISVHSNKFFFGSKKQPVSILRDYYMQFNLS